MPRNRFFARRPLVALGCALLLNGCITWREQGRPQPTVQRTLDGPVRITRGTGDSILLDPAQVIGDSIFGVSKADGSRVAIALADVARVEQQRENVIATLAIGAVIAAGAFVAYTIRVLNDPNY